MAQCRSSSGNFFSDVSLGCLVEDAHLFFLLVGGSDGVVLFDLERSTLIWLPRFCGGDEVSQ